MPISKKARVQREHKAADKAGTRVAVKPNGNPVKAAKPTSIVRFYRIHICTYFFTSQLCASYNWLHGMCVMCRTKANKRTVRQLPQGDRQLQQDPAPGPRRDPRPEELAKGEVLAKRLPSDCLNRTFTPIRLSAPSQPGATSISHPRKLFHDEHNLTTSIVFNRDIMRT